MQTGSGQGEGTRLGGNERGFESGSGQESATIFWNRKLEKGFATIPRLLPLVLHLIKILNNKGNPSLAYLEL